MKNLIEKSKKIVILPRTSFDVDIYASIVALTQVLKKMGKEVYISSSTKFPKTYKDLFELTAPNNVDDLGKARVVISIKKNSGAVDNVSWNENENQINFIIAPKGDSLDISDIKFDIAGGNFDLMITLGVSELTQLGPIYKNYKEAIDKAPKINIDINPSNKKYGAFNHVQPKAASVSDALVEAMLSSGIGMDKAISTALLGGILWKTEGLRYGILDLMTFKNVTSLISTGANYSNMINILFGSMDMSQMQLLGKVITKSKVYSDNVIGAILNKPDMQGVNIHEVISPEVNVLSHFKSPVSFVIAEHNDGEVWGTVLSSAKDTNLLNSLSNFNPVGRADRVSFIVKGSTAEIEIRLINELKGSSKPSKEEEPKEEVKKNEPAKQQQKPINEKPVEDPLKKASDLPELKPMPQGFGGGMGFQAPFSMPMTPGYEPLPKAKDKDGK